MTTRDGSRAQRRGVSTPTPPPRITVDDGPVSAVGGAPATPKSRFIRRSPGTGGSSGSSLDTSPEEHGAGPSNQRGRVNLRAASTSQQAARADTDVSPKVSRFGQQLRQGVPHTITCGMFCGGRGCKYENAAPWPSDAQALKGVFSHWVTKTILAMARPNMPMMKTHDMLGQFQRNGIRALVNLQERGEHAHCGFGLENSGYSYNPQAFMDADVFFYPFGWKDFGTPPMRTIFNMVKVMDFALQQGKVAVHCHAGLGRTGMLIACYLIYGECMTANEAITLVRRRRPGSIQTEDQLRIVQAFGAYIRSHRTAFTSCSAEPKRRYTAAEHLANERFLQHGLEARKKQTVPKIVERLCQVMLQAVKSSVTVELRAAEPSPHSSSPSPLSALRPGSLLPPISRGSPTSTGSLPDITVSPKSLTTSPRSSLAVDFSPSFQTPPSAKPASRHSSATSSPTLPPPRRSPSSPTPLVSVRQVNINGSTGLGGNELATRQLGKLANSTSNLPEMVASSSAQEEFLSKSRSSDQLHILPDYEANAILAGRLGVLARSPTGAPATPPEGSRQRKLAAHASPTSASSLDVTSASLRTPTAIRSAHSEAVLSPVSAFTASELLMVMAGLENTKRGIDAHLLTVMHSVNDNRTWKMLDRESDPHVLWMLTCHWLDTLKEPLLVDWISGDAQNGESAGSGLVRTCGEVNASVALSILDTITQVLKLSKSRSKEFLREKVLTSVASLFTHVSTSEVACQHGNRYQCSAIVDADTKRVKELLQRLLRTPSVSRVGRRLVSPAGNGHGPPPSPPEAAVVTDST